MELPAGVWLLTGSSCELCQQAERLYQQVIDEAQIGDSPQVFPPLVKVDVEHDERLSRRYGWSIPVILRADPAIFRAEIGVANAQATNTAQTGDYGGIPVNASEAQESSLIAMHLANWLETQLSKLGMSDTDSTGCQMDLFACIARGGHKLRHELYWPFPPSRLRSFLGET